jgi:hypothetical protein
MSVGQRTRLVAGHEEEGAETDTAQFGVEIAKQKPVWEKSPSDLKCEMTTKNNQAVLEQNAKIL